MDDRTKKDLLIIRNLLMASAGLVNYGSNPFINAVLNQLHKQITTAHRHATEIIDTLGDGEQEKAT